MGTQGHTPDDASKGDEHPLPVAETAPAQPQPSAVNPPAPPIIQQDIGTDLQKQTGDDEVKESNGPLLVRIIEDDELSSFERKTVRFGYWGVIIGFLSLFAACAAAYVVFQQFKEMAAQTELLSRGAKQARIDSAAASVATTKQIEAAQRQAKAAQQSLEIIRSQFAQEQRPYIAQEISHTESVTVTNGSIVTSKKPEPGKAVSVTISFQNVGKSNAIKFNAYRHVVFGDDIDNSHADPILASGNTVVPPEKGGSTTATSLKDTYSSESAIIDPTTLLLWNGTDRIYVFGAFTYFDRLGQYYCTPFRGMWLPDSNSWLSLEDFTNKETKKTHNTDELCPKYGKRSAAR